MCGDHSQIPLGDYGHSRTACPSSKPKSLLRAGAAGRVTQHTRTQRQLAGPAELASTLGQRSAATRSTRSRANPEAQPLRAQRSEKPRVGLQPACHPPAPAPLDLGCPWAFRGLLPADTQGWYTD